MTTTDIDGAVQSEQAAIDALEARRLRRRHDPEDKEARVVAATFSTIERVGYKRATVQQICRDADVAIGTFYEHFENRAQVLAREATADRVLKFDPDELADRDRIERNLWVFVHGPSGRLWRVWREALVAEPSLQPIEQHLGSLTREGLREAIRVARTRAGLSTEPDEIEGVMWAILALVRDVFRRGAQQPAHVERTLARAIWSIVHDGVEAGAGKPA